MYMRDIKVIEVVCGPGEIAYGFDKETGTLTFWTKDYIHDAPDDVAKLKIPSGFKTWSMEDLPDSGPVFCGVIVDD